MVLVIVSLMCPRPLPCKPLPKPLSRVNSTASIRSSMSTNLESRLANLPGEIEAGLAPEQIAKMLGESLRQHFLHSGLPDTAKVLQATSASLTGAQMEISSALRILADGHGGILAQVERSNQRIEYSVESRARRLDELLHEWKSDMVRVWMPTVGAASLLIGMFDGMEIQGYRDSALPAAKVSTESAVLITTLASPKPDDATSESG